MWYIKLAIFVLYVDMALW